MEAEEIFSIVLSIVQVIISVVGVLITIYALKKEFQNELAKQKKKLQGKNAAMCRARVNTWLSNISRERAELEGKF